MTLYGLEVRLPTFLLPTSLIDAGHMYVCIAMNVDQKIFLFYTSTTAVVRVVYFLPRAVVHTGRIEKPAGQVGSGRV